MHTRRPRRGRRIGIFVCAMLIASSVCPHSLPAQAETRRDLYSVDIEVTSRQRDERRRALGRALLQVMLRLTGRAALFETEGIQRALSSAENYARSYSYESVVDDSGEVQRIWLKTSFEPRFVERLLREEMLSLWPSNRPRVVIWLAYGSNKLQLAAPDDVPVISELIDDYSVRYGLPARLPLMDLEDIRNVKISDIARFNKDRLWRASERYQSDSVLSGSLIGTDESGWVGRWNFSYDRKDHSFAVSCQRSVHCARRGLDMVRELLLRYQGLAPEDIRVEPIFLSLGGVSDFFDYISAKDYLSNLQLVHSVTPNEIRPGQIVFSVNTATGPASLRQAIALDRRFDEVEIASEPELPIEAGATQSDETRPEKRQLRYILPKKR